MLAFHTDHGVVLAGVAYGPGEHEIAKPSKELVKHAGSAHAAGVLVVTEGLDESHVQSQADGEAAYAAAQGEWLPGHFVPAVVELDDEGNPVLDEDGRKIVVKAAYTAPGRWSGGWSTGNLLQHLLEKARGEHEAALLAYANTGDDDAGAEAWARAQETEAQLAEVEALIAATMSEEAA